MIAHKKRYLTWDREDSCAACSRRLHQLPSFCARLGIAAGRVAIRAVRLFRSSVPYNFACWNVNGSAQQPRQTDIQLRVETHTDIEAVYHMVGDANGDCAVNVLDLITIRNRLGGNSSGSWRGDVNLDGAVNVLDLITTRNVLGTKCE